MSQTTLQNGQGNYGVPPSAGEEATLREVRCEEHRATMRMHLFIAVLVGVLGMTLIMTGALVPFGIVIICLGVLYAAGVAVFAYAVDCVDHRATAPRAEELDSAADYAKAKRSTLPPEADRTA